MTCDGQGEPRHFTPRQVFPLPKPTRVTGGQLWPEGLLGTRSVSLFGPHWPRPVPLWTSRKQYNPIESIMTLIPKPSVNSWPGHGSSLFAFNIVFSAAEVKHALLCLPTLSAQGRNLFQTVPVHVCLTACESLEVITTEWCS